MKHKKQHITLCRSEKKIHRKPAHQRVQNALFVRLAVVLSFEITKWRIKKRIAAKRGSREIAFVSKRGNSNHDWKEWQMMISMNRERRKRSWKMRKTVTERALCVIRKILVWDPRASSAGFLLLPVSPFSFSFQNAAFRQWSSSLWSAAEIVGSRSATTVRFLSFLLYHLLLFCVFFCSIFQIEGFKSFDDQFYTAELRNLQKYRSCWHWITLSRWFNCSWCKQCWWLLLSFSGRYRTACLLYSFQHVAIFHCDFAFFQPAYFCCSSTNPSSQSPCETLSGCATLLSFCPFLAKFWYCYCFWSSTLHSGRRFVSAGPNSFIHFIVLSCLLWLIQSFAP